MYVVIDHGLNVAVVQAFAKLTALSEQRGKAYANADARVCLDGMFVLINVCLPYSSKHLSSNKTSPYGSINLFFALTLLGLN